MAIDLTGCITGATGPMPRHDWVFVPSHDATSYRPAQGNLFLDTLFQMADKIGFSVRVISTNYEAVFLDAALGMTYATELGASRFFVMGFNDAAARQLGSTALQPDHKFSEADVVQAAEAQKAYDLGVQAYANRERAREASRVYKENYGSEKWSNMHDLDEL